MSDASDKCFWWSTFGELFIFSSAHQICLCEKPKFRFMKAHESAFFAAISLIDCIGHPVGPFYIFIPFMPHVEKLLEV